MAFTGEGTGVRSRYFEYSAQKSEYTIFDFADNLKCFKSAGISLFLKIPHIPDCSTLYQKFKAEVGTVLIADPGGNVLFKVKVENRKFDSIKDFLKKMEKSK